MCIEDLQCCLFMFQLCLKTQVTVAAGSTADRLEHKTE